ncbi:MAG: beta-N-acetylhexosaminidase [Planctomycetota bacterium]|nr:beta-N-acetylhexosaminidase [Planctomycetota bacterium]
MHTNRAHALAAKTLCVGFHTHEVTPELRGLLHAGVRQVILFARNIGDRDQVAALTRSIHEAANDRVLVSVDQEGGRVQRLVDGFTRIGPMREIGSDPATAAVNAAEVATILARELRSVGIGLDFAPVVDVDTNPANPVIGERSFSRDPLVVASCARAFVTAMQSEGVAACAKHFPGHGDTTQDSHLELPRLSHALHRLESVELVPFDAAIEARVAFIMTAHILFDAIDSAVPATMSHRVLTGLLRHSLRFRGAIISDDLEMQAITDRYAVCDAAVATITAGADVALCCHDAARQDSILQAVALEAQRSTVFAARLEEAASRAQTAIDLYALPIA